MQVKTLGVGALAGALLTLSIAAVGRDAVPQQGSTTRQSGPISAAGSDDELALTKLNQLVGSWSVVGSAKGSDGSAQGTFQGESHIGWTLGGNFLAGDHVLWNTQGAALQMIDAMGFTPGVGFTRSEITNGDRSMFLFAGKYDDVADAIVFDTTNRLLTPTGQARALRTSFAFGNDGTVRWDTLFEVAGGGVGSVSLVMTRSASGQSQGLRQGAPPSAPQPAPGGQPSAAPDIGQMQSTLSGMLKQRQQMQSQMNQMQQQVQDMSRMMSSGLSQ
jgi:hypothetical protein